MRKYFFTERFLMRKDSVGGRIKSLRMAVAEEVGERLTQEWLAKSVGVSKSTVAKWETNVQPPDSSSLLRLADVLRTTPGFIMEGEPGRPALPHGGDVTYRTPDGRTGVLEVKESRRRRDDDQAFFDEVREILRDQSIPAGMRVLLIDAASSAWARAALYWGEVASHERARAVRRSQTRRRMALTGADTLPLKDPPQSKKERKRRA